MIIKNTHQSIINSLGFGFCCRHSLAKVFCQLRRETKRNFSAADEDLYEINELSTDLTP